MDPAMERKVEVALMKSWDRRCRAILDEEGGDHLTDVATQNLLVDRRIPANVALDFVRRRRKSRDRTHRMFVARMGMTFTKPTRSQVRSTCPRFTDDQVQDIVAFVKPDGLGVVDVWVKRTSSGYSGRAYITGCRLHSRRCPHITVHIGDRICGGLPFTDTGQTGVTIVLRTWEEVLVHVLAHEFRHIYQGQGEGGKRRKGLVWGSRGTFSERDADAYGVRQVRRWRRISSVTDGPEIDTGTIIRTVFDRDPDIPDIVVVNGIEIERDPTWSWDREQGLSLNRG